ncbi:hypothetical protein H072_1848 [Dactylellina haptotyla CBS 200.50]|uniref:Uncharacterized protein n=1 Tax=Dactylellina haptotyla (strain CBS 200.50) TaxID=1284197 RepID=S8AMT6_DACHA|nr:hypothetical protein H072_1848 [Dactylellina haptotyla CBS 200.50]
MAGFKKLLSVAAPLFLLSGVTAQQGTTDANPVVVVTGTGATTNVVVIAMPFTTVVDGTTQIITSQVTSTLPVPSQIGSAISSVQGSLSSAGASVSSALGSLSSAAGSLSSAAASASSDAAAAISGTTLITATLTDVMVTTGTESLFVVSTGTTIVSGSETSIIPDVTISTVESVFTSTISSEVTTTFLTTTGIIGNATLTGGTSGGPTGTETNGNGGTTTGTGSTTTTSSPGAAANVKVPVEMGGLVMAILKLTTMSSHNNTQQAVAGDDDDFGPSIIISPPSPTLSPATINEPSQNPPNKILAATPLPSRPYPFEDAGVLAINSISIYDRDHRE